MLTTKPWEMENPSEICLTQNIFSFLFVCGASSARVFERSKSCQNAGHGCVCTSDVSRASFSFSHSSSAAIRSYTFDVQAAQPFSGTF